MQLGNASIRVRHQLLTHRRKWRGTGERRRSLSRIDMKTIFALLAMAVLGAELRAQQPVYPALSAGQVEQLVAPIALYPDPLIGVILPASADWPEIQAADQFVRSYPGYDV